MAVTSVPASDIPESSGTDSIPDAPGAPGTSAEYRPGTCNIGPAEIARRRQVGHVGVGATVVLWAALAALDTPRWTRPLVALPATLAASGYLQARLRFCAGFGARGVFNFGPVGAVGQVEDAGARARDQARARQIGLASLAIGLAVGSAAVLVP